MREYFVYRIIQNLNIIIHTLYIIIYMYIYIYKSYPIHLFDNCDNVHLFDLGI